MHVKQEHTVLLTAASLGAVKGGKYRNIGSKSDIYCGKYLKARVGQKVSQYPTMDYKVNFPKADVSQKPQGWKQHLSLTYLPGQFSLCFGGLLEFCSIIITQMVVLMLASTPVQWLVKESSQCIVV